jgi:hypothetical protein
VGGGGADCELAVALGHTVRVVDGSAVALLCVDETAGLLLAATASGTIWAWRLHRDSSHPSGSAGAPAGDDGPSAADGATNSVTAEAAAAPEPAARARGVGSTGAAHALWRRPPTLAARFLASSGGSRVATALSLPPNGVGAATADGALQVWHVPDLEAAAEPSAALPAAAAAGGGGNSNGLLPVARLGGAAAALHCFPHGTGVPTNALHVVSAAGDTEGSNYAPRGGQDGGAFTRTLVTARLLSIGADLCVRHWLLVPAAAAAANSSWQAPGPLRLVLLSATRLESSQDAPCVLSLSPRTHPNRENVAFIATHVARVLPFLFFRIS